MIVEITIKNEDGTVVATHKADAMYPTQYRKPGNEMICEDEKYKLYLFTYQPSVSHQPLNRNK